MFVRGGFRTNVPRRQNCAGLLSANQVIRALPPSKVPLKEVYPKGRSSPNILKYKITESISNVIFEYISYLHLR